MVDFGYVQLYGCMPQSVSAGLGCGLGGTPALFVTTVLLRLHMQLSALYKLTLLVLFKILTLTLAE